MDVRVLLNKPGSSFREDPQLGETDVENTQVGIMGDILQTEESEVKLEIEIIASAPIEKLEIRNGLKVFVSGELVWKTDVFGVWGEFRSGFQCFCAFSSVGRATDF